MLTLYSLDFNWERTGLGAVVHVCEHAGWCTGVHQCDGVIREQAAGFESILAQRCYKFPLQLKP